MTNKPQAILLNALQRTSSDLFNFLEFFTSKPVLLIPTHFLDVPTKQLLASKGLKYEGLEATNSQQEAITSYSEHIQQLDFNHLEAKQYQGLIKEFLTANLPVSLELLDALAEAKETYEILGFITSNEAFQRERLIRDWCIAENIPTIHINHGAIFGKPGGAYANFACTTFNLTSPNEVEFIEAALADQSKQITPPKLEVTGMPSWDKYALVQTAENAAAFKASLGLAADQKLITFFPTVRNTSRIAAKAAGDPQIEGIKAFLTAVAEIAPQHPEVVFIIKDRPSNDNFVENLVAVEAEKLKINPSQLLYKFDYAEPYVAFSYLTLATRSTIACESLICQVPHLNLAKDVWQHISLSPATAIPPVLYPELAELLATYISDEHAYTQLKQQQAASNHLTGAGKDFCSSVRSAIQIAHTFNQPHIAQKLTASLDAWQSYTSANPQLSLIEQLENPDNPLNYHWQNVSLLLKYDQRFSEQTAYQAWLTSKTLPEVEGELMGQRMQTWPKQPSFHLIYPVFANQLEGLADSLDALDSQMYKSFGVSILSTQACPSPDLLTQPHLQWLEVADPFSQLNEVINQVESDWVMLLLPGDQLTPDALFNLAEYANLNSDWLAIYTDEDHIYVDSQGEQRRYEPSFKPSFNYELLLSTNYLGGCVALRKDALQALGGVTNLPYMQNEDLLLRLGSRMTLPAIGHLPFVSNSRSGLLNEVFNSQQLEMAGAEVRLNHLKERELTQVELLPGLKAKTWQVRHPLPNPAPKVAVLLPVFAAHDGLLAAITSLVEKTSYPNWQLYLALPAAVAKQLNQEFIQQHAIEVIHLTTHSRVEALTQLAAAAIDATFYCFAEADLHLVQDSWLENLVRHGLRPEVGLVAPRLVKPNGKIFGIGQVLGMNGSVDDLYADFHLEQDLTNQPRAWCDQNFSALNSSCVLISQENFTKFGLSADFANAFYLTDLGLRMQQQGLRLHFTPASTLASQGFTQHQKQLSKERELSAFYAQWFNYLAYDPAHNINLQLNASGNQPDSLFSYNWHPVFNQQPRVLILPLHLTGQTLKLVANLGYYLSRLQKDEKVRLGSRNVGLLAKADDLPHLVELARANADLILCVGEEPTGYVGKMALLKQLTGVKIGVYTSTSLENTSWHNQQAALDLVLTSQIGAATDLTTTNYLNLPLVEDLVKDELKQRLNDLEEQLLAFFKKN